MTIRLKILGLSTALLAILCAALFVSLRLQENVHEEIASITEYHIPINGHISDLDVATFDYELNLSRFLRLNASAPPAAVEQFEQRERDLIDQINKSIAGAERLIEKAIADPRNDLEDRLALARLQGTFAMLRRDAGPFEALGLKVIEARRNGDVDGARAMLSEFDRFARAFGPDLAEVRQAVGALTKASFDETNAQQSYVEKLSFAVFLFAAALGLGFAVVMATRLVGGLKRLVAGAHAVVEGAATEPLPVTSRDEVGQLTRAFNHMVAEIRAKDRIKDTFGKYLDPKIVAGLIDTQAESLDTAERRIATVFFSDIKGFSGLSEQLTAGVIANLLNRYFTVATSAIRAHNGVIDKYIGDSVMAFWAPPFSPGDAHAADACLAALAQQAAIDELRKELPHILGLRRQVPEFIVRMGLATGEVVVGTIGAPTAKSFTVIGDTVNLASRLEGINKVYGTHLIVAEDTHRLAQSAVEAREIDLITVAGKTEPVRIYEVMAPVGALDPERARLRDLYGQALALYRARDWDAAEAGFRACLEAAPADGPAALFLDRIAHFKASPPPPDWDGVWRVTEK